MTAKPLVSIVIVNYRRREALVRSLASALAQTYPCREIIVVDNHSEDGIEAFMREHAPEARLLQLPENLGACGGRNAGIASALGEILLTLDNDIYFESSEELQRVVDTFGERPDIHVLACQLCAEEDGEVRVREWCHARSWSEHRKNRFETHYFIEGACAYRREVFANCGSYWERLFIGCEGHDLALRIINSGYRILFVPEIRLRHLMSLETRTPERPYYFYTRNYIWIAYKDYHLLDGLRFLIPKLTMMFYFALRARRLPAFCRGVLHGFKALPDIRAERTPINKYTSRYLSDIEKWRPSLWVRLARHRRAIQL